MPSRTERVALTAASLTAGRGACIRVGMIDAIRKLIERLAPEPVCDECITARLELDDPQAANIAAHELAGSNGFERHRDKCALCNVEKQTTRRLG